MRFTPPLAGPPTGEERVTGENSGTGSPANRSFFPLGPRGTPTPPLTLGFNPFGDRGLPSGRW
jgi:hypothetical protein